MPNSKMPSIETLLLDSKRNDESIHMLLGMLKIENIREFGIVRVTNNNKLFYAGNAEEKIISALYECWLNYRYFSPFLSTTWRVIDYEHAALPSEIPQSMISYMKGYLTIIIEKPLFNHKDHFYFDIQAKHFHQLSQKLILSLHSRLNSLANLSYSLIKLTNPIPFERAFESISNEIFENKTKHILDAFNISENELKYIEFIASSCTSKQISEYLHRSPRSVEGVITRLKQKFNVKTKTQLHYVANYIFNHVRDQIDFDD